MISSSVLRRYIILCSLSFLGLCFSGQILAQTAAQNYIRVRTPRLPLLNVSDIDTTVYKEVGLEYFDGLGRSLQIVNQKATASGADLITPKAYDATGREARTYLPFTDGNTDGSYRPGGISQQAGYYSAPATQTTSHVATSLYPFADVGYEPSPLNRTVEQGAPGTDWQLGGHTVKTAYGTNGSLNISNWTIGGTTVTAAGSYAVGTLFSTTVTDENGNTSTQYKDFKGSVILKISPTPTGAGVNDIYQTYYVYNDLDQLAYVITPGALRQLKLTSSNSFTESTSNAIFTEHVYCYHYDLRGRVIAKKEPGKDWEYILYNALDQVVLTQDGNLRANHAGTGFTNSWKFVKYDVLGRVIQGGVYINTTITDPAALQANINQNYPIPWETRSGATYTNVSFPQQSYTTAAVPIQVLNTIYYDDYTFLAGTKTYTVGPYAHGASQKSIGLQTGGSVNVLGTTVYLMSAIYYDDLGHPIQHVADNQASRLNLLNLQYNFNEQLILKNSTYIEGGYGIVATTRYGFDKMGRKTDVYEKVSGDTEAQLSHYSYNDLGQVIEKNLHATNYVAGVTPGTMFLQSVDTRYNIRGWLTSINNASLTNDGNLNNDSNDLYGEELNYNESTSLGAPQWNGNISGVKWQTRGANLAANIAANAVSGQQGYAFSYDQENRLNLGQYASMTGTTWSLSTKGTIGQSSEKMAYDVMGNITALQRNDKTGAVLNNFAYSYQSEGNKLVGIVDGGTAGQTSNYIYDANGNMVTDSKKGITITYNLLNLPATIATATQSMTYGYDANGTKLYKVVTGTGAIRKDYIGELEATNWSPNFLYTDEGRVIHISGKPVVTNSGVNYAYEYSLKDHLGNTRVTFSSTNPVINGIPTPSMVQDYYPLGSTINPYINSDVNANANQYAYNGKEIQSEIVNLNLYDYGARFYDPEIARFTTADPLADQSESQSPYHAFANNPINTLDPNGLIDLPEVVVTAQAPAPPRFPDLADLASIQIGQVNSGSNSNGQSQNNNQQLVPSDLTNDGAKKGEIKSASTDSEDRVWQQDKRLTPQDIEKLKRNEWDHSDKGKGGGKTDLWYDPKSGKIYQKNKQGVGPGEPTGFNMRDIRNIVITGVAVATTAVIIDAAWAAFVTFIVGVGAAL